MSKKIDLIFKDLTFGALIAILCANCAMILCTAGINFLANQSINDLLIVLTMIPSVCVGVIAIYYLVCGCLSLQYIRLFMSFGGCRIKASMRYALRVICSIIISMLIILLTNFIYSLFYPATITNSDLLIISLSSSLFCFAVGCFFSSITTLFKPFISFIVISLICICYFIFVANLDSIISTTVNKGIINFAEPLFAVVSSVIFYFASTIILRLKRSDMKTTSIS